MFQSLALFFYLLTITVPDRAEAVQQSNQVFRDPANEDNTYILANLLFRARPMNKYARMYPHVIPFSDMMHPGMRSYQFGFPEVLRSGMSREVPTEIIFYRAVSWLGGAGIVVPRSQAGRYGNDTEKFDYWIANRQKHVANAQPVRLSFSKLLSVDFNLRRDLLDWLGSETRTGYDNFDKQYLYRDHIREFLVGTWESMREDEVFHKEEGVWTSRALACPDPLDVACFWKRFILVLISSKINTFDSVQLRRPTIDEDLYILADSVAVAFWLSYCRMLHNTSLSGDVLYHYCPNPCRNNPCVDMAHTMTDHCEVYLNGMYDKDYKCTCTENAIWSFSKRACVVYDRCRMDSPCSQIGSESCQYDPLTSEVKCYCKSGFMGPTCTMPRNACFERQRTKLGTLPTGNKACNVDAGSKCNPVMGSDLFSCECRNGWLIDTGGRGSRPGEELDPNCQLRHDPCMSLPCEVGDCVSSSGQAICQCPATHYGTKCQMRRGLWSNWGPWSSCDPDCGDRRERYRSRSCQGLNCLGHSIESDWCPSGYIDCGVPEKLGPYRTDRWRTAVVLRQMLAAMAIATAIGMGCLFTCQCFVSVALKCDRSLLDLAVRERAHIHQLLAYHRLSYKTVFRTN